VQILDHDASKFCPRPLWIEVFIAQNQSTLLIERPLRSDPESSRVPDVQ
jgi:hypothetical protein